VEEGTRAGLAWEELEEDAVWRGTMIVRNGDKQDNEQLGVRKAMCRAWVGRWAENAI
jgi:EEF1A N-terminal glycine/lysine methyltransferase